MKYLRTSDLAKAVKIHSNTVRLYEQWGLLPPVLRDTNGYRMFTKFHLEQVRLIRIAFKCEFSAASIRKSAIAIIMLAAHTGLQEAMEQAYQHLSLIQREKAKAEEALGLLEQWLNGPLPADKTTFFLQKEITTLLEISADILRNWERNGLIKIPRNPENGYRVYGIDEVNRLKVIRTLRMANYSMMSILRMMIYIDQGRKDGLRQIIDTPGPDEDIVYATDHWLSALKETEQNAQEIITHLKTMIQQQLQ